MIGTGDQSLSRSSKLKLFDSGRNFTAVHVIYFKITYGILQIPITKESYYLLHCLFADLLINDIQSMLCSRWSVVRVCVVSLSRTFGHRTTPSRYPMIFQFLNYWFKAVFPDVTCLSHFFPRRKFQASTDLVVHPQDAA